MIAGFNEVLPARLTRTRIEPLHATVALTFQRKPDAIIKNGSARKG